MQFVVVITMNTVFSLCRLGQAQSHDSYAQLSTLRWILSEMISYLKLRKEKKKAERVSALLTGKERSWALQLGGG